MKMKGVLALLILCLIISFADGVPWGKKLRKTGREGGRGGCLDGWTPLPTVGRCYWIATEAATKTEAQAICEVEGGTLWTNENPNTADDGDDDNVEEEENEEEEGGDEEEDCITCNDVLNEIADIPADDIELTGVSVENALQTIVGQIVKTSDSSGSGSDAGHAFGRKKRDARKSFRFWINKEGGDTDGERCVAAVTIPGCIGILEWADCDQALFFACQTEMEPAEVTTKATSSGAEQGRQGRNGTGGRGGGGGRGGRGSRRGRGGGGRGRGGGCIGEGGRGETGVRDGGFGRGGRGGGRGGGGGGRGRGRTGGRRGRAGRR